MRKETTMNEICGDNRFEIIAKAKAHLLDATNIDTSEDEMKVLDNFLFRCWQMGWLDRYAEQTEPNCSEKPNNCEPKICDRLLQLRRKERGVRYIDADALKDKLQQHHDFYVMAWGGFGKMPIGEKKRVDEITNCIAEVVNAPSIDIVRCKECKHREKYPCDEIEFYECSHLRLYGTKVGVEDDWFCADGEREGE